MTDEVDGARSGALADDFAAANAAVIAFTRSGTAAQWGAVVPGEEWPVGVVIHHIAEGHALSLRWLETMAQGDAVIDSADDIDARNVEHAARCATISQEETAALLVENGTRTEAALRRLSDDQLDRTAPFGPAGGHPLPVAQLAAVTARHALEHLGHARHAVAGTD
jgi:hypothetical protein